MTPADVQRLVNQLGGMLSEVSPRLQTLAAQPGASELANAMASALAQRFAARSIKFVFGAQSLVPAVAAQLRTGSA